MHLNTALECVASFPKSEDLSPFVHDIAPEWIEEALAAAGYLPDEPRVVGGAAGPAGWRDEQSNEEKLDRGTSAAGARARNGRS